MRKAVLVFVSLLLLASVASVGVGCSDESEADYVWRCATGSMPGDGSTEVLEKFAELVDEKSDGEMEIRVFTKGTLYDEWEAMYNALEKGRIDLCLNGSSYYQGITPLTSIAVAYSIFQTDDIDELLAIEKAMVASPMLQQEYQAKNVNYLFWAATGQTAFLFRDHTVTDHTEMAGMTLLTGGGAAEIISQMYGSTTQTADTSEWYTTITQDSDIDGTGFVPFELYTGLNLYEVLPYATVPTIYVIMSTLMNQDSYDELPANLQAVVDEAAAEAEAWGLDEFKDVAYDQLHEFDDDPDVTITVLNETQRAAWFTAAIWPAMAGAAAQIDAGIEEQGGGSGVYTGMLTSIIEAVKGS